VWRLPPLLVPVLAHFLWDQDVCGYLGTKRRKQRSGRRALATLRFQASSGTSSLMPCYARQIKTFIAEVILSWSFCKFAAQIILNNTTSNCILLSDPTGIMGASQHALLVYWDASATFCPGWPVTGILPPSSASSLAGITGMYHCTQLFPILNVLGQKDSSIIRPNPSWILFTSSKNPPLLAFPSLHTFSLT
jgi:hypothetical protein